MPGGIDLNSGIFTNVGTFALDTSTVGTFGYEVSFPGNLLPPFIPGAPSFYMEPSVSACIDLVVTPPCTGVTIAAVSAGGEGMPLAGTIPEDYTVTIRVHACQNATDLKVQGGTNGWTTNSIATSPSPNPTVGGPATVKNNNKNQVITWIIPSLAAGSDADLYLTIDGTINADTTPGTILGLLGSWSVTYSLDGGQTFQKASPTGAVTVTVEPPL